MIYTDVAARVRTVNRAAGKSPNAIRFHRKINKKERVF